jgi:hypothetical protein
MKKILIAFMAVVFVMTSVLPTMAHPPKKTNIHRGNYRRQFYSRRRSERHFGRRPCNQRAYYDYDIRATRHTIHELTDLIYDLKTLKRALDGRDRSHNRNRRHGHDRYWR